ncbi:MAG: hypothetical protein FWH27_08310 [Planctomycetaceae bacterium]|nr:hypothetical protein [Planctomycetaceae bacterium]
MDQKDKPLGACIFVSAAWLGKGRKTFRRGLVGNDLMNLCVQTTATIANE